MKHQTIPLTLPTDGFSAILSGISPSLDAYRQAVKGARVRNETFDSDCRNLWMYSSTQYGILRGIARAMLDRLKPATSETLVESAKLLLVAAEGVRQELVALQVFDEDMELLMRDPSRESYCDSPAEADEKIQALVQQVYELSVHLGSYGTAFESVQRPQDDEGLMMHGTLMVKAVRHLSKSLKQSAYAGRLQDRGDVEALIAQVATDLQVAAQRLS